MPIFLSFVLTIKVLHHFCCIAEVSLTKINLNINGLFMTCFVTFWVFPVCSALESQDYHQHKIDSALEGIIRCKMIILQLNI